MKKKIMYKCTKCGFETKEKHQKCPLCYKEMEEKEGEIIEINPTLPEKFDNTGHEDVELYYHCFKCDKKKKTRVCLDCNNVGSMVVEYNGKKAIINRIKHLRDVFSSKEVEYILSKLSDQEKTYIYHNYESAYRFFYRKDTNKSIVCFIFSVFLYFVFLDLAFGMLEDDSLFLGYFLNLAANSLFLILVILGFWYRYDATMVEFKNIPMKVGLFVLVPNAIQLLYVLVNDSKTGEVLISGYITMILTAISYIIYILWWKKHEK